MNTTKIFSNKYFKHFLVLLYFFGCTIYITWPLVLKLTSVTTGMYDELYITWILNWNIHAITNDITQLFNGNIFYPYPFTLSYSELFLSSSLIALIPVLIFKEPILAYNINLIISFALLGFCTYLLVFFLTKNYASSIVAGTICSFSTFLIPKTGHLQVLAIFWIPLCLLCFLAYIKYKEFKYFLLMMVFFYMQFVNSFMPAYFLVFSLTTIAAYEIWKKKSWKLFFNRKVTFTVCFFVIISLPIIYPYYYTSNTFNYTRDIREAIHTANRPEFFFYNYEGSRIGDILKDVIYTGPIKFTYDGYRGLVNIILTFSVLAFIIISKKRPPYLSLFVIIGISTYIISLGPAFQLWGSVIKNPSIIPLPYALLYYIAPGFQGFRNSGRWEVFEIVIFAVAIGIFLSITMAKTKLSNLAAIFLCIAVLAEYSFSIKFYPIHNSKTIPEVYRFINKLPDDAVISEFPIYTWDMFKYSVQENKREYYSTFHFKKTLNGTGGFSPPPWEDLVWELAEEFPADKAIEKLESTGIQYIVVHGNEFDTLFEDGFEINGTKIPNSINTNQILEKNAKLKLIFSSQDDFVYEIQ